MEQSYKHIVSFMGSVINLLGIHIVVENDQIVIGGSQILSCKQVANNLDLALNIFIICLYSMKVNVKSRIFFIDVKCMFYIDLTSFQLINHMKRVICIPCQLC